MMEFSEQDHYWMQEALKVAKDGIKSGEVPVGAIFVNTEEDKLYAKSHNLTSQTKNATTHCEINCIREIRDPEILRNLTVYVTVEPCIMCGYALNLAKIKRVVFGTKNDKFGGNGSILSLHKFKEG